MNTRVWGGGVEAKRYASAAFAEVYREWGEPRRLSRCGGSVLLRSIGETGLSDAMGCYPLFSCQRWDGLDEDLAELGKECVSLVMVADPFAPSSKEFLDRRFDVVRPFKQHFVADLSQPTRGIVSAKRYRSARAALRRMAVEIATNAEEARTWVDDWMALQNVLDFRHGLSGMRRLSRDATTRLFETPGLVLFRARVDGATLGMHIDFVEGDRAYAHLAAYSAEGYRRNASTALSVFEIDYFRGRAARIDWGGVAGREDDPKNGLGAFKARFSNTCVSAYLCGKIFDPRAYAALTARNPLAGGSYFPAYRAGEGI